MKILPDYLIQYMPEIEEAMEELRLSVIDHAYELLQRLDIDELTTDEIRRKLELYDIRVSDMKRAWLPNGKFYRLYPYIKHHRSRLNAIRAIAKSGGQFEGIWSSDFSDQPEYEFYKISVGRHYQFKSNADGYFYVSGDSQKDVHGRVVDSAATALTTDILINQALPAGYTYLYVPWPRPVYPGDSGYFYNVHMLDFDRLHYSKLWGADNEDPLDENDHDIHPDYSVPASTLHDWNHTDKKDSPYRTPYWFDYHYMDDMRSDEERNTWPIKESGTYKDEDGIQTNPENAVIYELSEDCKELQNSHAVFPTKYYTHARYRTTDPNRSQTFTPLSAEAKLFLESFDESRRSEIVTKISEVCNVTTEQANYILDHVPCKLPYIDPSNIANTKEELESVGCVIKNFTIDENYLTDVEYNYSENPSTYRYDYLARGYALKLRDNLSHIKTYKPFWNEKTPFLDMCYQNNVFTQHSYYTIKLVSIGGVNQVQAYRALSLCLNIRSQQAIQLINQCPVTIQGQHTLQTVEVLRKTGLVIEVISTSGELLAYDKVLTLVSCQDSRQLVNVFSSVYSFYSVYDDGRLSVLTNSLPMRLYRTADKSLEEIKAAFDAADAVTTLENANITNSNSLYNWLNLKESNNIINAALYDDSYNEYKRVIDYRVYVKSKSVFPPPPGTDSDLKRAIYFITGVSITNTIGHTKILIISKDTKADALATIDAIWEFYEYWGYSGGEKYELFCIENYEKHSVVKENVPPISEITHTSYDRPTCGKLDSVYIGYTLPSNSNQGENKTLSDLVTDNKIYSIGESSTDYIKYDPELFYTVVGIGTYSNSGEQSVKTDNVKAYLECAPSPPDNSNSLFLNTLDDATFGSTENPPSPAEVNYIVYKTSRTHKLYFSQNKNDVLLKSQFNMLYNELGSNEIYYHYGSAYNNKGFEYSVVGIYDSEGHKIDYANKPLMKCTQSLSGSRPQYYISCGEVKLKESMFPNLNKEWKLANGTEDEQYISQLSSDYTVYRSISNVGVNNSTATMYIELDLTSSMSFTFKYMNCSEQVQADYLKAYLDGAEILDSSEGDHFYNPPIWQSLDVTVSEGKHTLEFVYAKTDDDGYEFNDCAYVAIPHISYPDSDYASASYILFTTKVFDGHVEDTPIVNVFVKTPNDEIITTSMIPDIGKIQIDGNYITLEEFDRLGYSFETGGTTTVNYKEASSNSTGGNAISYNDPNYTFENT